MSDRLLKLNDLLRDETARAIQEELDFEAGIIVTVTRADVSPTLENANIKLSIYPESKSTEVLEAVNKKIYEIQQVLNSRLKMRPVPKIRFELDRSEEKAEKVEKIFDKISSQGAVPE